MLQCVVQRGTRYFCDGWDGRGRRRRRLRGKREEMSSTKIEIREAGRSEKGKRGELLSQHHRDPLSLYQLDHIHRGTVYNGSNVRYAQTSVLCLQSTILSAIIFIDTHFTIVQYISVPLQYLNRLHPPIFHILPGFSTRARLLLPSVDKSVITLRSYRTPPDSRHILYVRGTVTMCSNIPPSRRNRRAVINPILYPQI
jgi:hypothetical protein